MLEYDYWTSPDFRLIHDGQRNPGQFEFPPEDIKCFTRKYERINGFGFINGITFKYDLRNLGKGEIRVADIIHIELSSAKSKHKRERETYELVEYRRSA